MQPVYPAHPETVRALVAAVTVLLVHATPVPSGTLVASTDMQDLRRALAAVSSPA
jgi:hypothetical protein